MCEYPGRSRKCDQVDLFERTRSNNELRECRNVNFWRESAAPPFPDIQSLETGGETPNTPEEPEIAGPAGTEIRAKVMGRLPEAAFSRARSQTKDSHKPDTTASLTGTSPCHDAIEPPCTERYARWCERSATQLMAFLLESETVEGR